MPVPFKGFIYSTYLRILASYEAKTATICNFWTFWWPVIQLINRSFTLRGTKMFFVGF